MAAVSSCHACIGSSNFINHGCIALLIWLKINFRMRSLTYTTFCFANVRRHIVSIVKLMSFVEFSFADLQTKNNLLSEPSTSIRLKYTWITNSTYSLAYFSVKNLPWKERKCHVDRYEEEMIVYSCSVILRQSVTRESVYRSNNIITRQRGHICVRWNLPFLWRNGSVPKYQCKSKNRSFMARRDSWRHC